METGRKARVFFMRVPAVHSARTGPEGALPVGSQTGIGYGNRTKRQAARPQAAPHAARLPQSDRIFHNKFSAKGEGQT